MPERSAEEGRAGPTSQGNDSSGRRAKEEKNMQLYNILGIPKNATEDDIKKAYRRLALRYHPDKNLAGDPELTEKFKEINHANAILSNPQKRKVYDELGEPGLKMMEQFGEDEKIIRLMLNPWFKWLFLAFGLLSCGFCCCCCFCCCCYFCCGRCKPPHPEGEEEEEWRQDDLDDAERGTTETDPVTEQPGRGSAERPAVIAMPPPPAPAGDSSFVAIPMPPPESTATPASPTTTYGAVSNSP